MSKRFYLSQSDMRVEAEVRPIEGDPSLGEPEISGHALSVREVRNGEWFNVFIEGDVKDTFRMACERAEVELGKRRGLVLSGIPEDIVLVERG